MQTIFWLILFVVLVVIEKDAVVSIEGIQGVKLIVRLKEA